MKKIMLVIFNVGNVDNAIERSLELAEENKGELFVTFIMEEEIPSALSSLMMYTGFLGEKIQEDVEKTIREEYRRRVEELIKQIKKQAEEIGIKLTAEIIKKGSLIKCYDLIKEKGIDYIVINYTRDQYISRTVMDYYYRDFINNLEIPYEIFLDGKKK